MTQKTPSERLIIQGSVIDIAKKAQPSVVGIQTHQTRPSGPQSGGPGAGEQVESVGSGVIIKQDGFIMTNSHVVGSADSIVVTIGDEKVPGEVVGKDKDSDIAVIKVSRKELPVAKFGEPDQLEVGELAVAIGSPFGFQHSVTAGVISALDRHVTVGGEVDRPRTYTGLIQTDAAINPGNSGGALINRRGEVIGINTLIYSTNGVSQGIGFAIPADEARGIAEDIVNDGEVQHPQIGVEGRTLLPESSEAKRIGLDQGAIIVGLVPDGPAELAGINPGDVITAIDGNSVKTMDQLVAIVRDTEVGQDVVVRVWRDKAYIELGLTIQARD